MFKGSFDEFQAIKSDVYVMRNSFPIYVWEFQQFLKMNKKFFALVRKINFR